jgi:hypothetical protein
LIGIALFIYIALGSMDILTILILLNHEQRVPYFYLYLWFLLAIFLVTLGFELRASCLLGRYYTPWAMHQPFFALFMYFFDRVSHFCLGPASDLDPPTCASHIAGITGANHLIFWDRESCLLFDQTGLEPWFSRVSCIYGCVTYAQPSFSNVCKFLMYKSFTSLVRFIL